MSNIIKSILNMFKDDSEDDGEVAIRFPDKESVYSFIGKKIDDQRIDSFIDKWFFFNERANQICDDTELEEIKKLRTQFDLLVDSLFIFNNADDKVKTKESFHFIDEYIKKFDIFILGFENYLTSIISKRIFDSNSYKHKLNIEL